MMNLKSSYKYQIKEYKTAVIIFYVVILLVISVSFISNIFLIDEKTAYVMFGGMEMASMIFLFIIGLSSFKEAFYMLLQNGISRRTVFISRVIAILTISVGMALFDKIINIVAKWITQFNTKFSFQGLYEQLYRYRYEQLNIVHSHIESFFYVVMLYVCVTMIGYFITIAYYRMNKALKLVVSIGIPVGIFIVIPMLDTILFGGKIGNAMIDFVDYALGFSLGKPYHAMVTSLIVFIVFGGLSWLLMRRAVDKQEG